MIIVIWKQRNLFIDYSVTLSSSSLLIDHLMRGMDNKFKMDAAPLTRLGVQERRRELFTCKEQRVIVPTKGGMSSATEFLSHKYHLGGLSRLFLLVDRPSGVSIASFDGTKYWGKTSIRPCTSSIQIWKC
jgi:hypothetical protein